MSKEVTMSCRDGQLRPGYGVHNEVTMSCRDGQLRPGYGIHDEVTSKVRIREYKKVA